MIEIEEERKQDDRFTGKTQQQQLKSHRRCRTVKVRFGSTQNGYWDRAQPHNIETAPATVNRLGARSRPFQMVNSAAACKAMFGAPSRTSCRALVILGHDSRPNTLRNSSLARSRILLRWGLSDLPARLM